MQKMPCPSCHHLNLFGRFFTELDTKLIPSLLTARRDVTFPDRFTKTLSGNDFLFVNDGSDDKNSHFYNWWEHQIDARGPRILHGWHVLNLSGSVCSGMRPKIIKNNCNFLLLFLQVFTIHIILYGILSQWHTVFYLESKDKPTAVHSCSSKMPLWSLGIHWIHLSLLVTLKYQWYRQPPSIARMHAIRVAIVILCKLSGERYMYSSIYEKQYC